MMIRKKDDIGRNGLMGAPKTGYNATKITSLIAFSTIYPHAFAWPDILFFLLIKKLRIIEGGNPIYVKTKVI